MRIKKLIGCAWLLPLILAAALALPAPARAAVIEGVRPDPLNISVATKTLKGSKTAYEQEDKEIISNFEYDRLYDELKYHSTHAENIIEKYNSIFSFVLI